ncbi:hypothetical protein SK128_024611 [Halocaridina rubra]|uniref:Uncharacterized protein n=1 Tax=Halocaridina rubra TaxID=373956 RepID=A0AAN9A9I4_HALRR
MEWRQTTEQEKFKAIAYCGEENLCYVSRDTGTIWTSLPSYIGALMGYSPSLQKMFAQDYVNKITFSTMDGINWAPETNAELILEQSSLNWVSSKAIPYLPSASGETIGSWSADANGVSKDGTILAYWGKCCQHLI